MRLGRLVFGVVTLALSAMSGGGRAASLLFSHGRSDYVIVVGPEASATERYAAAELQAVLRQVGGAMLPIVQQADGRRCVHVGWNHRTGRPRPAPDDEACAYETLDGDLYIYGGSNRGTLYGVYAFLHRELGLRWYASDVTRVPHMDSYELPRLSFSQRPAFPHRLCLCYDALRHHQWLPRNGLNNQNRLVDGPFGRLSAFWGYHTFHTLVPPERYFSSHPDYFSLYQGRRSDRAQLCLSNRAMRRLLVDNLKTVIRQNPGYWCYDVSQNDNSRPCECRRCQRLVRRYGGQSGALLWFVNQVAGEVAREFPEVYIGTFAYLYTRHAPTSGIRPARNVVVRLCDIECCMAHPLEDCPRNSSFLADMEAWTALTPHVFVWDYATGFRNYLLPFPNFRVMARNMQYFSRSGVMGILEEGGHDAPWSEFSELKQWMIARLLWNPWQDVDALAAEFIAHYYGPAAPYVQQYYSLCQQQVTPDVHFTIKLDWQSPLFSGRFQTEGQRLLGLAEASARTDDVLLRRVRRLSAQLCYLAYRRSPFRATADGTLSTLTAILRSDSTIISEMGYTLGRLLEEAGE